jgi:hypothetical protein
MVPAALSGPVRATGPSASQAPLLALADALPGAGAQRVTELLARHARRALGGHVLALGPGVLGAGLGGGAPASLEALSRRLARGVPVRGALWGVAARDRQGRECRVINGDPRACEPSGLEALLALARVPAAHALVVAWSKGPEHLQRTASHVARVLPAAADRLDAARRALAGAPVPAAGRELLIACRAREEPAASRRALKGLAAERGSALLLLPHLGEPGERPARALREAQVGLQALCGWVSR